MSLLITDRVIKEIEAFSKKWPGATITYTSLKLTITMSHLSLNFYQPERYTRIISCYFDFGNEIHFFYEDVRSSIENSRMHSDQQKTASIDASNELSINDEYVMAAINFCSAHIDDIMKLPPSWFKKATEISDQRTRKNFPDIADADLRRKNLLWISWIKPSRST